MRAPAGPLVWTDSGHYASATYRISFHAVGTTIVISPPVGSWPVETHKSHFCMEITLSSSGGWRAESAPLGFAPVVPGSLGISNLRLRPLIIPLSKLPNIWVCKIGLEISHKHAFPSGISVFVCQWSPGLWKGTEDSALKPKVLAKCCGKAWSFLDWWLAYCLLTAGEVHPLGQKPRANAQRGKCWPSRAISLEEPSSFKLISASAGDGRKGLIAFL